MASCHWTADRLHETFLNRSVHSGLWGLTIKIHAYEFDYAAALRPVRFVALIGVGTSCQAQLDIFILEVDPGLATHPAQADGN